MRPGPLCGAPKGRPDALLSAPCGLAPSDRYGKDSSTPLSAKVG